MKITKNIFMAFTVALIIFTYSIIALTIIISRNSFSIIALSDTQYYAENNPEIFCSLTDWIIANRERINIIFVSHLGDIVQNGGKMISEWKMASRCLSKLDNVVPYSTIPGNHDYDIVNNPTSGLKSYNTNFYKKFLQYGWYKGHYKGNANNYQVIKINNETEVVFLNLEPEPTDDTLKWAEGIVKNNTDKFIFITTHIYLLDYADKRTSSHIFRPHGNTGEDIWNKLVKNNCNIKLVLSGHFCTDKNGDNVLKSKNMCGEYVSQITQDYQERDSQKSGLLRIYMFYPQIKRIISYTYSVVTKKINLTSFMIL